MPDITDPQVVAFSNNDIRPAADHITKLYERFKSMVQNYNSDNIGSQIDAAGAGELIADGSANDGRTQITGGDIYNFITMATAFIAFVEGGAVATSNRLDVIYKPTTDV